MTSSKQPSQIHPPLVFNIAGLKPDIHLQVFNQAFHGHSLLLKAHSEFFRTFLDSPDKANQTSSSSTSKFKYEWVTKVDEDGNGWSLVWKYNPVQASQHPAFKGDQKQQIEAFHVVMQALHIKPITIGSVDQLRMATDLADYYRLIPVFSYAFDAALPRSYNIISGQVICSSCLDLLATAAKLKHKALFTDCLIYSTANFNSPPYRNLQDPKLREIAEKAYQGISKTLLEAHKSILSAAAQSYSSGFNWHESVVMMSDAVTCHNNSWGGINLPLYYRLIHHRISTQYKEEKADSILGPLLKNNLRLNTNGHKSGSGAFINSFLCAEIADEDLPWDVESYDS